MDVILLCIQTQLHLWLLAIQSSTMNFMNSFNFVESIQFIWNFIFIEAKKLYADSHDLLPIILIIAFIGFNFVLFITALFFNKSSFNSKVNKNSESSQVSEHSNAEQSNESIENSSKEVAHQQDIVSILESEQAPHPAQQPVEAVLQIAQSIQPSTQSDPGHIETVQFETSEEFAPEGYSSDSEATLQASDQRRRSDSLDSQSTCEVDDLQVGGAVGSEKVQGWLESDVQDQVQGSWNFSNFALVVVGSLAWSLAWTSTNAFEPEVVEVVKVETLSVSVMLERLIDAVLSEPFAALKDSPELFATIVVTGLIYLFLIISVIRFLFETVKPVFSSSKDQPLPPIDEMFEDSDGLLVDEGDSQSQSQSQNGQVASNESGMEHGEVNSVTSTNQSQQEASHLLKLQSTNKVMADIMYQMNQGADLELISLREEIDGLKMESDGWKVEAQASKEELSSVQGQYEGLVGELEKMVKQDGKELKEIKEKLKIESSRAQELEAEVVERDLQIAAKSEHHGRLQDTIDSKDLELLAQREEMESLRKKLELTQYQLTSQESKLFELELERNDDLNAASEEISELEQEVVQLTKERDDLSVQREELWDELDEAYGDQAALETFKDELKIQVTQLEETSKESQEKTAELARVNELLKKKVSKLQKQNADILQDAMWKTDGGMRTKYEPAGPYKVQAKNGFKRGEVLTQVEVQKRRKGLRKEFVRGTKIASSGFSDESGMASSKIFGH